MPSKADLKNIHRVAMLLPPDHGTPAAGAAIEHMYQRLRIVSIRNLMAPTLEKLLVSKDDIALMEASS